jgi:glucose uptake protein GlcU
MTQASGFLAVAVAIVFYGSNYVPTKKFPVGPDGLYFQWCLCTGILVVGLLSMPLQSSFPVVVPAAMLGGALWATGNLLVIPVLNRIGLGIGLLLWSVMNLLVGYGTGKLKLFGMTGTPVKSQALNLVGAALCVFSMVFFFFVKPDLRDEATRKRDKERHDGRVDDDTYDEPLIRASITDAGDRDRRASGAAAGGTSSTSSTSASGELGSGEVSFPQRCLGFAGALTAGVLYGFSLVPSQLWLERQRRDGLDPSAFDTVFSQMLGVYCMSTVAFIGYIMVRRNDPLLFPTMTLPAMISGAMWGVATASWIYASSELGFVISYPMITCGPTWVSSAWAVFGFREITDRASLRWLAIALLVNHSGVLCIAFSSKGT